MNTIAYAVFNSVKNAFEIINHIECNEYIDSVSVCMSRDTFGVILFVNWIEKNQFVN